MGSVPASGTHVKDLVCKLHVTCVPLADYILLMTPQLEVLKHFGHGNFDDNRSARLLLFGMMFE